MIYTEDQDVPESHAYTQDNRIEEKQLFKHTIHHTCRFRMHAYLYYVLA